MLLQYIDLFVCHVDALRVSLLLTGFTLGYRDDLYTTRSGLG